MKVEIKSVKVLPRSSQETTCFEATLLVDGVVRGFVHNEGHGGANIFSDRQAVEQINAYAATLPEVPFSEGSYPQSAETIVDDLVDQHLLSKDLKRLLKSRILYVKDDKIYEVTHLKSNERLTGPLIDEMLKRPHLKEKLGSDIVLNTMPFDEALALYVRLAMPA